MWGEGSYGNVCNRFVYLLKGIFTKYLKRENVNFSIIALTMVSKPCVYIFPKCNEKLRTS